MKRFIVTVDVPDDSAGIAGLTDALIVLCKLHDKLIDGKVSVERGVYTEPVDYAKEHG